MNTERLPIHDPGGLGVFALMAKAMMDPGWPLTRTEGAETADAVGAAERTPADPTAELSPRRPFLQRLEHWFWARQQRDIEAYLAQASDIHDLETRMRLIERRSPHPYF